MRMIDADALEAFVKTVRQGLYLDKTLSDMPTRDSMLLNFQQYVHLQPTIDAVPVVRGEWIKKTYIHEYANEETEERQYVVCSICGKQPPAGFGAVNFCPNCGADMRESEGST